MIPTPRLTRLGNTVAIASETTAAAQSVAVGLWLGGGSRHEPADQAGVTHLLEHMVFRGALGRSARAIAEETDRLGGEVNAFTDHESLCLHAQVCGEDLASAFDLLAAMLLEPALEATDLECERAVVVEELDAIRDLPEERVEQSLLAGYWPHHPLGRPIIGRRRTLQALTADDLVRAHADMLRQRPLLVTAAGRVEHDALVELADRRLGSLSPPAVLTDDIPPATTAGCWLERSADTGQGHIAIAAGGCRAADTDATALELLAALLGGGASSRLVQEIREQRGLAYEIHAEAVLHRDCGRLQLYAATRPRKVTEVSARMLDQLEQLARTPVDQAELERARAYLAGALRIELDSPAERMSSLGEDLLLRDGVRGTDEIAESIATVAADDVRRLAAAVRETGVGVAVLGPLPKGFRLAEALAGAA